MRRDISVRPGIEILPHRPGKAERIEAMREKSD